MAVSVVRPDASITLAGKIAVFAIGAAGTSAGEIDWGMPLFGAGKLRIVDEEQPTANTRQKSALMGRRSDFIRGSFQRSSGLKPQRLNSSQRYDDGHPVCFRIVRNPAPHPPSKDSPWPYRRALRPGRAGLPRVIR